MKILNYNDIGIEVLEQSKNSSVNMKLACDITQKMSIDRKELGDRTAKFLIDAKHTSIFEHSSMTFLASGISRSLLAQVTRQRHFSFTSASQHYQDYRDYPMSIRPGIYDSVVAGAYKRSLEGALRNYIQLIELGEKPEEARQVLPNACTVNLVITANARALSEFLITRKCSRNTLEMRIFADILHKVCQAWLPEIFSLVGPYCKMNNNECDQGIMSCRK